MSEMSIHKLSFTYFGSSSNLAPSQISSIPITFCDSSSEENSTTAYPDGIVLSVACRGNLTLFTCKQRLHNLNRKERQNQNLTSYIHSVSISSHKICKFNHSDHKSPSHKINRPGEFGLECLSNAKLVIGSQRHKEFQNALNVFVS